MDKRHYLKNLAIGLTVIFIYFASAFIQGPIFNLFNIDSAFLSISFVIIYQLMVILTIMYIYKEELATDFKEFRNNRKQYMKPCAKYLLLSFLLVGISNAIIMQISNMDMARNQEEIVKLTNALPLVSIILAVMFAPILEELVFRLSIRKVCGNKNLLFIILSGVIFAALHVIGVSETWQEYLFIISYSIPGFIFAYALVKSNNIFVPIVLHTINNAIGVGALILLSLLQ